jgi:hypothetical protein
MMPSKTSKKKPSGAARPIAHEDRSKGDQSASLHPILRLQQTMGNRAVRGLLEASGSATPVGVLRARVSGITGTDVGAVPVEKGETGGARSVTHEGRVSLGSEATEHDVAHELAHAAQQRSSSGAWLGPGGLEERADEIANAVLSGGNASVSPGRAPHASILAAGEPYDRETITLAPPPAGFTIQDFKDQLKAKVTSGEITGFSTSEVKAGDPEEKFLFNALVLLANKQRWGSELDIVTSIGAGKGMVTVRFDAAGKAEARLVGKGTPTVVAAFGTVKDASKELVSKFKLASVTGEKGRNWKVDELNKVLAAWSRLSPAEAAALEGYTLIRTNELFQDGEPLQGQTAHSDEVKTGETKATHLREIRFADSAFAADEKSFIGDDKNAAPASFEVLIHEVGHALEAKPFDDLNAPAAADAARANKAANDARAAQLQTNAAINAARKKRFPQKDVPLAQSLLNAVSAAHKALQAFERTPDDTHQTDAANAISARDTTKAAVAANKAIMTAFTPSLNAQDRYFAALKKLLSAMNTAAASRAKADALKSGPNTKRLQTFIDFVKKEKIPPPTAYAAKHWPGEPAEFFDEAFSLWKNDPVFFAKYSSKLKAWFDAGKHLE